MKKPGFLAASIAAASATTAINGTKTSHEVKHLRNPFEIVTGSNQMIYMVDRIT